MSDNHIMALEMLAGLSEGKAPEGSGIECPGQNIQSEFPAWKRQLAVLSANPYIRKDMIDCLNHSKAGL